MNEDMFGFHLICRKAYLHYDAHYDAHYKAYLHCDPLKSYLQLVQLVLIDELYTLHTDLSIQWGCSHPASYLLTDVTRGLFITG